MVTKQGWIGVDLDGTLAEYHGWDEGRIGKPIWPMIHRVRDWLDRGLEVRIVTSRVGNCFPDQIDYNIQQIDDFCLNFFGKKLPITNMKDQFMIELWDDRAVRVEINTGRIL